MTASVEQVSSSSPLVTVVIPVRHINDYVRESLLHLLCHPYPNIEVIILPDVAADADGVATAERVQVVPTGPVGPAEKRDRGAQLAHGEILAFLDDDAYPATAWLAAALPHFSSTHVAAVGGPTLTPAHDSFWQQASGAALSTLLGSGGALIRYRSRGRARDVDDWPSVNLLVRKSDFDAVGGFNCAYYPGEDTKLCLDLAKRLGKRIVYEPEAVVYHHRRPLFWGHYQQIGQYAVHRGYFAKIYPETSRRLAYFLPAILAVGLLGGLPIALLSRSLRRVYIATLLTYTAALGATALDVMIRTKKPTLGVAAAFVVGSTHAWYGLNFIRGLLTPRLPR
ncbi:MAG: glycosyltransferase [Chloroflexi bacterium]|nr:glycosyltransferase [Chloroflexota bacterium]